MHTGRRLGYARTPVGRKTISARVKRLRREGCELVFADAEAAPDGPRPELDRLLAALEAGDTLVVGRLDQLGRTSMHLLALLRQLATRGIAVRSLGESLHATGDVMLGRWFDALVDAARRLDGESRPKPSRRVGETARSPSHAPLDAHHRDVARQLLADPGTRARDVVRRFGMTPAALARNLSPGEKE